MMALLIFQNSMANIKSTEPESSDKKAGEDLDKESRYNLCKSYNATYHYDEHLIHGPLDKSLPTNPSAPSFTSLAPITREINPDFIRESGFKYLHLSNLSNSGQIKFENNNNFIMPINENYFIKVPEDSDDAYLKPSMDNCINLKVGWMIVQNHHFKVQNKQYFR